MKDKPFLPCVLCGETTFIIHAQATGPVQILYAFDGTEDEVYWDKIRFRRSEFVRCAGCHKIRSDVMLNEYNNIVNK